MFRRLDSGLLEATEAAQAPRTGLERFTTRVKRLLIGSPIATVQAEHERLTKFKALAVLSSDAISSVAYATEAILATLIAAGSGNLGYTLLICFAIVALLAIVALSYRQTIPAYPNGGGSYIVAKDNLGTVPGLVAAASLMIDYVLTVSVSISAGVLALATLFSALQPYIVIIDVALVVIITVVNLRGVRESGSVFSIPTYVFIGSAFLLILVGTVEAFLGNHQPLIGHFRPAPQIEALSIFLILRSFAAGCSAMTGVEAISNGIPAFKKPEPRNAAITLTWMAVILGTLFIGITVLALSFGIEPYSSGNPTVIGQLAQTVFHGPLTFMYPVFQIATLFILTLAANTSYSDFPRLSSLLARDHFLPHQFAFRGDRLAFSIGIIVLAILAGLLLIVFKGDTTLLLNLYAVGVFMSFTLSQGGMVKHWWRLRKEQPSARRSMVINGLGATATLLVAVVISTTKFLDGAWVVVLLIPLLILMFLGIRSHYLRVERERTTDLPISPKDIHHRLIVPIKELDKAAKQSLAYARSISSLVTAVYIKTDAKKADELNIQWEEWQAKLTEVERVQLDVIDVGRSSLVRSLVGYITTMREQHPAETLTVILPEVAARSLLAQIFEHSRTFRLKMALFFRPEIVVTSVPWYEYKSNTPARSRDIQHRFIVPVSELDRATLQSLAYARSISPYVIAVHVAIDPHDIEALHEKWGRLQKHMTKKEETQLVIIESPYRSLVRPLLAYVETVRELHLEETITVILPEFVVAHWWEYFLHNQTALQLKRVFAALPGLVVTDIPQHIERKSKG
ncbi:MAG: APC family permease [Ktedonobacteraceae bacterium]|nr:APC family permease [Ktedonobacteraceae bacterium]